MKLSDLIKKERDSAPPRLVLHGIQKIGKSTFGAGAPGPIFIPTEAGLTTIDVPHFPLATELKQVWEYIDLLLSEKHDYQTVIVDTVDWLERLIWAEICRENSVDSIEAIGYGKGYNFALKHWDKFFRGMDALRNQGMAVLILTHTEIKTYNPPDGESYDRYQIKLHKTASAKLEEWADAILFANYLVYVNKASAKASKGKATGSGERVIYTSSNNPAFRAGNRYSLPETLPMDFNTLLSAIKGENSNGAGSSKM